MRSASSLLFFALAAGSALAIQEPCATDDRYQQGSTSTSTVACQNLQASFPTFASFLTFPNIGAAFDINGINSPSCGICWNFTLTTPDGTESIFFTAIDQAAADEGFIISLDTLDTLTNGTILFGVPIVDAEQVDNSLCGL